MAEQAIALPSWRARWQWEEAGTPAQLAQELREAVEASDFAAIAGTSAELDLLGPFAASVNAAMHWQPSDQVDQGLEDPGVADALRPVAGVVARAPGARWWLTPVASAQSYVELPSPRGSHSQPVLCGSPALLQAWRSATLAENEAARSRPEDVTALWSGWWWSTPEPSELVCTTRSLPGLAAVGLAMIRHGTQVTEAACWLLKAATTARIFEISCPGDWVQLVERYPLSVTWSRRHDWWRVTSRAGEWLIPDWAEVAADYDAVHLSGLAYLATAGRALNAGAAATVLAGWGPDETYWLTDTLVAAGPVTQWRHDQDEPLVWLPSGTA